MLEDNDFIKSCDVPGPTKEAIRAIILYKSEVSPHATSATIFGANALSRT